MASEENMFIHLENFIGQNVPDILKLLLYVSGYDTLISIKQLTSTKIANLEQWINKSLHEGYSGLVKIFENNAYNESVLYKDIIKRKGNFEFLPGHRDILSSLPKMITDMQAGNTADGTQRIIQENDVSKYSVILTKLIESANKNFNKSKYAYQYNDTLKYFATYVFLLCGRMCYETLSKNLPIPSTKTIRKYIEIRDFNCRRIYLDTTYFYC